MTHKEKIAWMANWVVKHKAMLVLEGECGFGRECVGILIDGKYPDYEWYEDWDRMDNNGEVWMPKDAYHKHPCVAVLGRGEEAESQLYDWLKWFDDNGFVIEAGWVELSPSIDFLDVMLGRDRYCRMVKTG